jgi:hypothetical protein
MASHAPLLMGLGSSMVVTTGLLWKLVGKTIGCTCEPLCKTLTTISTNLPISQSYL